MWAPPFNHPRCLAVQILLFCTFLAEIPWYGYNGKNIHFLVIIAVVTLNPISMLPRSLSELIFTSSDLDIFDKIWPGPFLLNYPFRKYSNLYRNIIINFNLKNILSSESILIYISLDSLFHQFWHLNLIQLCRTVLNNLRFLVAELVKPNWSVSMW